MILKLSQPSASSAPRAATPARGLLGRFATHFADSPVSFDVVLPNGTLQHFGPAAASFHVTLKNARALRAVTSLDEGRFGDAYLAGDIDLEGDMLSPFQLRGSMKDFHLAHLRLALHPAADLRPGAHQPAGDHRALRHRSRISS